MTTIMTCCLGLASSRTDHRPEFQTKQPTQARQWPPRSRFACQGHYPEQTSACRVQTRPSLPETTRYNQTMPRDWRQHRQSSTCCEHVSRDGRTNTTWALRASLPPKVWNVPAATSLQRHTFSGSRKRAETNTTWNFKPQPLAPWKRQPCRY